VDVVRGEGAGGLEGYSEAELAPRGWAGEVCLRVDSRGGKRSNLQCACRSRWFSANLASCMKELIIINRNRSSIRIIGARAPLLINKLVQVRALE
jgi:hypothetical protein